MILIFMCFEYSESNIMAAAGSLVLVFSCSKDFTLMLRKQVSVVTMDSSILTVLMLHFRILTSLKNNELSHRDLILEGHFLNNT